MENNYAPANSLASDNYAAQQYINTAGSLMAPAIVGLVLAWFLAFAGQIVGLILSGRVLSKIANLPFVDESTLDAATLETYLTAKRKVKTANVLAKITKILSLVTIILLVVIIVGYVLFFGGLIALGM